MNDARQWQFPNREHFFITDVHADADAFLASLEATGGVHINNDVLALTERGRDAVFVMGGDYFDKGPSNLALLRALRRFIDTGASVVLLAGNHDIRTLLGIRWADEQSPKLAHLFVRLGAKVVPLLAEVWREIAGDPGLLIDDAEVARRIFPAESWWSEFPRLVADLIPAPRLVKELHRARVKRSEMCAALEREGMTLGMAYAAIARCREMLCAPGGEHAWLQDSMDLAYRAGSFLFAHAGVDDVAAQMIASGGVADLNRRFGAALRADPFVLYNGHLGNMFRTKYRDLDFPFTQSGAEALERSGIHAIVHGHKTHITGQQIEMRHGIINFECDASLDRNTRLQSGLAGVGRAATIIGTGSVRAISSECESVRVLFQAA